MSDLRGCSHCGVLKPFSEFHRNASKPSGYVSHCKECARAQQRAWYERNAPRCIAQAGDYRRANPQMKKEADRRYRQKHTETRRAAEVRNEQTRRARKAGNGGSYTQKEWRELCQRYGMRCLCCGVQAPLTPDHVKPLSRGGTNDIGNIQPLCLPCNLKKGTRDTDYR